MERTYGDKPNKSSHHPTIVSYAPVPRVPSKNDLSPKGYISCWWNSRYDVCSITRDSNSRQNPARLTEISRKWTPCHSLYGHPPYASVLLKLQDSGGISSAQHSTQSEWGKGVLLNIVDGDKSDVSGSSCVLPTTKRHVRESLLTALVHVYLLEIFLECWCVCYFCSMDREHGQFTHSSHLCPSRPSSFDMRFSRAVKVQCPILYHTTHYTSAVHVRGRISPTHTGLSPRRNNK